ncbi:MAG: type III secretion system chaperone [Pseudomonadota bacterium]
MSTIYSELLANFGRSIGLPDLVADEEGYCALSFDELAVNLQLDPATRELLIFAHLGEIDDDDPSALYARMLAANSFWQGTGGATLGIEPETQAVFLARTVSVRVLDDAAFEALLEGFIQQAEHWRQEVETFVSDDVTPGILADAEPEHRPAGPTNFIVG